MITKTYANSVLKGISKNTGINFTENSLVNKFIVDHYPQNKDIIGISQLTNKNFNYILKVIEKYLKPDINDLYNTFYKRFHETFGRSYNNYFDGRVNANNIK